MHYYGDSYAAAKKDIVTRSGLLLKEQLFNDQQHIKLKKHLLLFRHTDIIVGEVMSA